MGRHTKGKAASANDLVNFHFSSPAAPPSTSYHHAGNNNNNNNNRRSSGNNRNNNHNYSNNNNNNRRRKQQNHHRSAEDSASARRKAKSAMFPLHSSADHAFVLTRRSRSKVKSDSFPFSGCDNPVAWDSVLAVTQLVQLSEDPCCPICLSEFTCARITKCGHSFCLPCVLRHVQSSTAINPYQHVKCPCCGIPLLGEDLRPVVFDRVSPPMTHGRIKLIKLHRTKTCSAPFLPQEGEPKHASPISAPTTGDKDAKYCRFNYVDPRWYQALLVNNLEELQMEATASPDNVEAGFLHMAMDMVLHLQQNQCGGSDGGGGGGNDLMKEELELIKRLTSPSSGVYQMQSDATLRRTVFGGFESNNNDAASLQSWPEKDLQQSFSSMGTSDYTKEAPPPPMTIQSPESTTNRRLRGDSVGSYKSEGSHDYKRPGSPRGKTNSTKWRSRPLEKYFGSRYIEDSSEVVHFYQAEDGQLVYLCGFNMACLSSDFSKEVPQPKQSDDTDTTTSSSNHNNNNNDDTTATTLVAPPSPPFPDFIEGTILDLERVHLTWEVRNRMPFLSHLPLFSDICLVELDLNHILSDPTRTKFKNDLQKRRKRRQQKVQAEKKADREAMQHETEQINERKARWQQVDPDDDFFKPVVVVGGVANGPQPNEELNSHDEAAFPEPTPASAASQTLNSSAGQSGSLPRQPTNHNSSSNNNALDFSRACRRAENQVAAHDFPALGASFPALGSSSNNSNNRSNTSLNPHATNWSSSLKAAPKEPTPIGGGGATQNVGGGGGKKKKKGKGQKILLFSTGGQRGIG